MWPGISLYFIGLAYANSCTGDGFAGKNINALSVNLLAIDSGIETKGKSNYPLSP